jgi:hypothetical protein
MFGNVGSQVDLLLSLGDSLAHSPAQPPIFQPRASQPSNPATSGLSYGLPGLSSTMPEGRLQSLPQQPPRAPLGSILQVRWVSQEYI